MENDNIGDEYGRTRHLMFTLQRANKRGLKLKQNLRTSSKTKTKTKTTMITATMIIRKTKTFAKRTSCDCAIEV